MNSGQNGSNNNLEGFTDEQKDILQKMEALRELRQSIGEKAYNKLLDEMGAEQLIEMALGRKKHPPKTKENISGCLLVIVVFACWSGMLYCFQHFGIWYFKIITGIVFTPGVISGLMLTGSAPQGWGVYFYVLIFLLIIVSLVFIILGIVQGVRMA